MSDSHDDTPPRRRRDSDEQGWSRPERTILRGIERIEDKVDALGDRVAVLELHRAQTQGADQVQREIWKWVLGVLATLVAAAALYLAGKAAG